MIIEVPNRSPKVTYYRQTFRSFFTQYFEPGPQYLAIPPSVLLRFCTEEDLHWLRIGYGFPEEIILISLVRFVYPQRWIDVKLKFPGRDASQLCRALYWFLDFMIVNWGYLLLKNLEYWLPVNSPASVLLGVIFAFSLIDR